MTYDEMYCAVCDTLDFADVTYERHGIEKNLDAYQHNKQPLIELLRKHPNWNEGINAIVMREEEHRDGMSKSEAGRYMDWFACHTCNSTQLNRAFTWDTVNTNRITDEVVRGFEIRKCYHNELHIDMPLPIVGQKTSRWVRKALLACGADENDPAFRKKFAEYADKLADVHTDRTLIISVNLADYLTMSYGTNWASCHIINPDIANGSNSYEGCYKAGTLSYMNDECSVIAYTVDELPDDLSELPRTPRLTRQMFMINPTTGRILQSRMYPYTDHMDLIDTRRRIMQGVIACCMDKPNLWKKKDGCIGFLTHDDALHYKDYGFSEYHPSVSVYSDEDFVSDNDVEIGYTAYCLECGDELSENEYVQCNDCRHDVYVCAHCGDHCDDEDEGVWLDGEWYCDSCVISCDHCGEYMVRNDDVSICIDDHWFCSDACAIDHGYRVCEYCEEWYHADDGYVDATGEHEFCSMYCAHHSGFYFCDHCGELTDDWIELDGRHFCDDDCACREGDVKCEHCGALHDEDNESCPNCGVVCEVA